ncbi:MAG: radical SAM protein [Flavobacteriales bacterium]
MSKTHQIRGFRLKLIEWRIKWHILVKMFLLLPHPDRLIKGLKGIIAFKSRFTIREGLPKVVRSNGRIFLSCNVNGFPSKNFFRPVAIQALRALNESPSHLEALAVVQVALTKKCPLNCEHCFEGEVLNQKDTLTLEDHKRILDKLIAAKVPMVHYAGGEPMNKFDDLLTLLSYGKKDVDFSLFTSGYKMTEEHAFALKEAGLTGVYLSIDHYIPEKHNAFRRNEKVFQWAIDAAANVRKADMILTFTLCVTKETCNKTDLMNYMQFAAQHDASFVMLLEPRSVGNYAGMSVELSTEETAILDAFYTDVNTSKAHEDLPLLVYPAHQYRSLGCAGAASMMIYVDTDGYIQACPYCRNKSTHILGNDYQETLMALQTQGCANPAFTN